MFRRASRSLHPLRRAGARTATFTREGPFDQISTSTDWAGKATGYGYWPSGALRTVTDPTSRTTTFDVLESGHAAKATDNFGHATNSPTSTGRSSAPATADR
ncbi:hypothetical protein [Amycolatopsis sp. NPDC051903]|uniref:hypothetical protein n=1 Tax=Amycolatopsis sp. NPDC051903 TaxID=3363936 RepID=UPI0037B48812